jgi:hypothetical protein
MPNKINAADTSNIDDVIAYLESPEYLRMAAQSAGEDPRPLLSGSSGQGWVPAPEGAEDTRQWLGTDSVVRVTQDIPGVGAPRIGDEVYIYQNRVPLPGGGLGYTVGSLGASDHLWVVEYDALTSMTPAPVSEPTPELISEEYPVGYIVTVTEDTPWCAPIYTGERVRIVRGPLPASTAEGFYYIVRTETDNRTWNVPASALAPVTSGQENAPESPFGITWDSEAERCMCLTCETRRQAEEARGSNTQTPAQLTTRRAWWVFRDVMASLRPFRTRGALRGVTGPECSGAGSLGDRNPRAAILWSIDRPRIDYVVYSYDTPIAWHVNTIIGGEWVFPMATYSQTTSRHQSKIRTALENLRATQGYSVRVLSNEGEM